MVPSENKTVVVNREQGAEASQTKVNVEQDEANESVEAKESEKETTQTEETLTPEDEYYKKYFSQGSDTPKPDTPTPQNSTEQSLKELREAVLNATAHGTKAEQEQAKRNFRQYIADADFEGAETYLLKRQEEAFLKKVEDLETNMQKRLDEATQRAVEQATSASSAKISIETYIDGIITPGSELSEFRRFIESESDRMVQESRNAGKVNSIDDYVQAKKAAVKHVADDLIKRLGLVKGKAKASASARKQEVLASEGVRPGSNKEGSDLGAAKNEPPQDQSVGDYISGRQQLAAKLRGLN